MNRTETRPTDRMRGVDPAGRSTRVVVIGSSAGGLEPLREFLRQLPIRTGAAYVVVRHLPSDTMTALDQILGRVTQIPIRTARDGMHLEPDHLYLVPPGGGTRVCDGAFRVAPEPGAPVTGAVDTVLSSVAEDPGRRPVAVILSGSGSDGARGVSAIHAAGGTVIVQDPETCEFDGMTSAAIRSGAVSASVPPDRLAGAVLEAIAESGRPEKVPTDPLRQVLEVIQRSFGLDFENYKVGRVVGHIERAASRHGVEDLEAFAARLRIDATALDELYRDLLVEKTGFFSDAAAFAQLERALPRLLDSIPPSSPIRVWVAGCATGQEAYSMAILFKEVLTRRGEDRRVRVFATDVHPPSLRRAATGVFGPDEVSGLSRERLDRHFTPAAEGYRIAPDVRQMIVFAQHNVLVDAPFSRVDLASCRNLLHYLVPLARDRVLRTFLFSIREGGLLFLGRHEGIGLSGEQYEVVSGPSRIFRRMEGPSPSSCEDIADLVGVSAEAGESLGPTHPTSRVTVDPRLVGTYETLLHRLVPCGLLVDDGLQVVRIFGAAGTHLTEDEVRRMRLGTRNLGGAVRTAQARLGDGEVNAIDLEHVALGRGRRGRLHVERLPENTARRLFLVSIHDVTPEGPGTDPAPAVATADPVAGADTDDAASATAIIPIPTSGPGAVDLAEEVAGPVAPPSGEAAGDGAGVGPAAADDVPVSHVVDALDPDAVAGRSLVEVLHDDDAQESLLASNEELQCANEELQTVNEELFRVNAAYQSKITELRKVTADLDNLLKSTEIGTIFLDHELCIRRFTPAVQHSWNLRARDVGRPLGHFHHTLRYDGLVTDVKVVLGSGEPVEREVSNHAGEWFLVRITPYRTDVGEVDGAVMTFTNITRIKRTEALLADKAGELQRSNSELERFAYVASHDLQAPLRTVASFMELLEIEYGDDLDEEARRYINFAKDGACRMKTLITDLLAFSRAGKPSEPARPIDLGLVMEEVARALDAPLRESRAVVDVGELPTIHGYPGLLQQVFQNLVENAVKFRSDDPPRVSVTAEEREGGWCFHVADNGVGIEPEERHRIFEIFHRLHARERYPGNGIGLALVRKIVERHHGRIWADGNELGGSTFSFTIGDLSEDPPPAP